MYAVAFLQQTLPGIGVTVAHINRAQQQIALRNFMLLLRLQRDMAKGVIKPLLSYSLLCLAASYIRIPDAMAAFSDSTFPHMGMRIRQSAASAA